MRAILVDLDETLYAPGDGLIRTVDSRITAFIAGHCGLPWDRADRLRVELWREHGTTARGLNLLYDIPQREVYRYAVDAVDPAEHVAADPQLAQALSRLSAPCYIFTNATRAYAARVLEALGVGDNFAGIFDIEFADYHPKPSRLFYERVVGALGLPPDRLAFVEDNAGNFGPALRLGMSCVQVGGRGCPPEGVVCVGGFQEVPGVLSPLGF